MKTNIKFTVPYKNSLISLNKKEKQEVEKDLESLWIPNLKEEFKKIILPVTILTHE